MITQKYLKEALQYHPPTGIFVWRTRPLSHFSSLSACTTTNAKYAGKLAGNSHHSGYSYIQIQNKLYAAHRLAWLYVNGADPEDQIDHINGVRDDNKAANLRVVSHSDNGKNQRMKSNNTSGQTGVCWYRASKKWIAQIRVDGKSKHLGYFDDFGDAVAARKDAEKEAGFHPNHGDMKLCEK